MKTVAIAIMTMVLLLAAGYLLGAVLGLVFGLVSTAATKLLYLWNDDKFAPQRRGGRKSKSMRRRSWLPPCAN